MPGFRTIATTAGLATAGMATAWVTSDATRQSTSTATRLLPGAVSALGAVAGTTGLVLGGRMGALAASLGAGLAAGGLAHLLLHRHNTSAAQGASTGVPRPSGPGTDNQPAFATARHNIAVAWWPVNMGLEQAADAARIFSFQTLVANMGTTPFRVDGARIEYEIYRRLPDGTFGERVGSGSAPLDHLDVTVYPPPFGVEVGRPAGSFGVNLRPVCDLAPGMAGNIGASHAMQHVNIGTSEDGMYVLRQRIVQAPGSPPDDVPHDDVRDTDFMIRNGTPFELGSRYAD